MRVEIYTSRDRRTGEPLNVKEDGYKFEYPDIPVEVELDYKQGEWEVISAKVMEDLALMLKFNKNGEYEWVVPDCSLSLLFRAVAPIRFLLRKGQEIELDDDEFNEAVDRAKTTERDWKAEQFTSKE
jgi:hypothetical protein